MAKKIKPKILRNCRDCVNVTLVTDFHTLTIHGREPTLGRCPYWTESKSMILSIPVECKHFKSRA